MRGLLNLADDMRYQSSTDIIEAFATISYSIVSNLSDTPK